VNLSGRVPLGVGIDIEDVARWRKPNIRWQALFTEDELAYCRGKGDPALHFAGFWCLKEAVFKAAGSALDITLRDIIITHRADGTPRIELRGQDESLDDRLLVSVSHSPNSAVAIAIFLDGESFH